MPTIDFEGNEYEVYADLETAEIYAVAAIQGEAWREADEDDRSRGLITGTRVLERQRWKGEKTVADQPLAWPRKNTGIEGVVDDEIPTDITNANIELAIALLDGSELQSNATTAERIQSMSAGSVSITNYRSRVEATRFPLIVQELISKYLAGAGAGTFMPKAIGVDKETIFPIDLGYSGGS